MPYDDMEYFERRAEEEIELARKANHTHAVQAHYQMACAYLDKVHSADGEEVDKKSPA